MDHVHWWRQQVSVRNSWTQLDYFESSNSNHGSSFCFVLKMSSTNFPMLSDLQWCEFCCSLWFWVSTLCGYGPYCQHFRGTCYNCPKCQNKLHVACSSERMAALAPFHTLRTCNSKIILMNSLNFVTTSVGANVAQSV